MDRDTEKNRPSVPPALNPTAPATSAAEEEWRAQNITMEMLKDAYSRVDDAEKRIAEQDRRIRELEDLAATDPLTGLMNRRGFEKFFEMEQARIRRQHSPGALFITIDLDRFKPINDTYGHLAGDACLRSASQRLMQSVRMLDGAARIGGDEFTLLLTQLDPEKAPQHLEKIKALMQDLSFEWAGEQIPYGASVGAALVTAESTFADVYDSADKDLYADKKNRHKRTG